MKLIVGLLTLLCVARLAHSQDAQTIGDRDNAFLSFSDGFPDGTLVTIFYNHKDVTKEAYINFYGTTDIGRNTLLKIPAHITIAPSGQHKVKVDTHTGTKWKGPPTHSMKECIGTGTKKDWWRIDVYKFDKDNLKVFVQGSQTKDHQFTSPLDFKSVYIFGSVDTDNVYIKYRIPGGLDVTTLEKFKGVVEKTMKESPPPPKTPQAPTAKREATPAAPSTTVKETVISTDTSNIVKIPKFEKNMKIFITAWMGSREENQKDPAIDYIRPRIQMRWGGKYNGGTHFNTDAILAAFTIYHEWDNKIRKSYIDVVHWKSHTPDECVNGENTKPCEPEYCVVDGSTSDLEHYRIERIGDNEIEVITYYVDADPTSGKMGKSCKTTAIQNTQLKDKGELDIQPFEIHGMNGAIILNADIQ